MSLVHRAGKLADARRLLTEWADRSVDPCSDLFGTIQPQILDALEYLLCGEDIGERYNWCDRLAAIEQTYETALRDQTKEIKSCQGKATPQSRSEYRPQHSSLAHPASSGLPNDSEV